MVNAYSDHILAALDQVASLYQRLVLVVGPAGSGKTSALRRVEAHTGAPLINVNLALSRRLLELTERQRQLRAGPLLADVVEGTAAPLVLLDQLEILFDPALRQDPLRCLQGIARRRTIVAAWAGEVINGDLVYARPDHPEYRRYPARDLIVLPPTVPI